MCLPGTESGFGCNQTLAILLLCLAVASVVAVLLANRRRTDAEPGAQNFTICHSGSFGHAAGSHCERPFYCVGDCGISCCWIGMGSAGQAGGVVGIRVAAGDREYPLRQQLAQAHDRPSRLAVGPAGRRSVHPAVHSDDRRPSAAELHRRNCPRVDQIG